MSSGTGASVWCRDLCNNPVDTSQQDATPATLEHALCGTHWKFHPAAETGTRGTARFYASDAQP